MYKGFRSPSAEATANALGSLVHASPQERKVYDGSMFSPLPKPRPHDWLASEDEPGQSFESFRKQGPRLVPHGKRRAIVIQPWGSFEGPRCPPLSALRLFASAFYHGLDVVIRDPLPLAAIKATHRINSFTKRRQFLTGDLLGYLRTSRRNRDPERELMAIVVTMEDIYPRASWNFVYGQASLAEGVGVWSFARLDPGFPDVLTAKPSAEEKETILRRSVRILVHELGHMFGLAHCIYYTCLLNGAMHEEEMDRQPLWLCPGCLRKLHDSRKFGHTERYTAIYQACQELGLEAEAAMYARFLEHIGAAPYALEKHRR